MLHVCDVVLCGSACGVCGVVCGVWCVCVVVTVVVAVIITKRSIASLQLASVRAG